MVGQLQERVLVMSFRPRLFQLIALSAAGALALSLAGCGVKGPLEPPPASGVQDPAAATTRPGTVGAAPSAPAAVNMIGQPVGASAGIASGTTSSAVTQAPTSQQSSVLDWLVK
jgi:predicted small lipoprotein YifL